MTGSHNQLASLANEIASIPSNTKKILKGQFGKTEVSIIDQRFKGESGFMFNYHPGERSDLGYLLLNRYDADLEMSVSELVDLNTQETLHQWHFDVDPLWEQSTFKSNLIPFKVNERTIRFRNVHSYLLADGTIVARHNSPFFSVDLCSNLSLLNDESIFHHSIETDHDGNFWTPKHFDPKTVNIGHDKFFDDGIAQIAPDGTVLLEKSVINLLDENGLGYLIYGEGQGDTTPSI